MAAGRIILAHAFPTIKEVLTDNQDAILCEPNNYKSLKTKLKMALKASKNNELGIEARKKALNNYSWDKRVSKLFDFINTNALCY